MTENEVLARLIIIMASVFAAVVIIDFCLEIKKEILEGRKRTLEMKARHEKERKAFSEWRDKMLKQLENKP